MTGEAAHELASDQSIRVWQTGGGNDTLTLSAGTKITIADPDFIGREADIYTGSISIDEGAGTDKVDFSEFAGSIHVDTVDASGTALQIGLVAKADENAGTPWPREDRYGP